MIQLRPYQIEALESIRANVINGIRRQIIHLPTAAGKTVIFASLIDRAMKKNPSIKIIVLAFSCELLGQARDKIKMIAPDLDVGLVDAHHKEFDHNIVICSVQTARVPANLERLRAQGFSIGIADEAHHFASDSARFVLNELGFSKEGCATFSRLLVGFTATPFRQDSRGLREDFDSIVFSKTIKDLIDKGFLAPPIGRKVHTDLNLSQMALENGDYSSITLSKVMNTPEMNELVVRSYLENAVGRKSIVFTCSIEHSNALAELFQQFGIFAQSIHSQIQTTKQEEMKALFKTGEIEVLVNPLLLTEGFDEPSIECVIVARPTKSLGLYQQMVGRGLRLYPNKRNCLVLDFSDQHLTLCNVGILLGDQEEGQNRFQNPKNGILQEIAKDLPPKINKKLKKAILEFDLLGQSFTWEKDLRGGFVLKGADDCILEIVRLDNDQYDVILRGPRGGKTIAKTLDFEYAFGAAEAFANANRGLFAVSDLNAQWRSLPISEKQKELFHSSGFRSGIEDLTRGQAAQIISSGILSKKGSQRRL